MRFYPEQRELARLAEKKNWCRKHTDTKDVCATLILYSFDLLFFLIQAASSSRNCCFMMHEK
jgi:hypothetical protein